MKKLNLAQIRYIDIELLKLDFKFVDIRYEMTDHIASVLEEKEGKFKDNLREYFIKNRIQLIKQYNKTKRLAVVSAIMQFFKTLVTPYVFALATVLALVIYFSSKYIFENEDINFFGLCVLFVMLIPLLWFARNNRDISVMRPMALIQTFLYFAYQSISIVTYSIDHRNLRILPLRLAASVIPALMFVLIISLYRCRKHYAGKYI